MSLDELVRTMVRAEIQRQADQHPPQFITRHNSKAVTGTPWRTWLDVSKRPDFDCEVLRVGKLVLINFGDLLDWLRNHTDEGSNQTEHDAADAVLDEIIGPRGLRVV